MPDPELANSRDDLQINRPIMIGGCGSSGTTLLRKIFNLHPTISCGQELSLLNKRVLYQENFRKFQLNFSQYLTEGIPTSAHLPTEWLPSSVDGINQKELRFIENPNNYDVSIDQLELLANRCSTFQEFLNLFFTSILNKNGKKRWAEKTPTNCYCIGEFLALYPEGYYIQVIRDGRDVVPSLMKRGWTPPAAVRRWMYDTSSGLPFRHHPRYIEFRYEDLAQNPEAEIKRLFTFLQEEIIPDMQHESADNSGRETSGHPTWTLQPEQKISTLAIEKWKSVEYPDKKWIMQLFKYTRFSKNTSSYFGFHASPNGNELLDLFGYDSEDRWDIDSKMDWRFFRHYLREKRGKNRPEGVDYFQVTLP